MFSKAIFKDSSYAHHISHLNPAEHGMTNERKGTCVESAGSHSLSHDSMDSANQVNISIGHVHSPDVDNMMQVARRKMLRRAANRKSAQLSRARKKAHMEELKLENARLQKVVDILESQPELLFCVTIDGKITYIAERTLNFIKSAMPNAFHENDPIHINQILSDESVSIVLRTVAQLTESENAEHESMSSVKEVSFRDTAKYHAIGYLRCSCVIRSTDIDDGCYGVLDSNTSIMSPSTSNNPASLTSDYNSTSNSNMESKAKKARKSHAMPVQSQNVTSNSSDVSADTSIGAGSSVGSSSSVSSSSIDLLVTASKRSKAANSIATAVAALSSLSHICYTNISSADSITTSTANNTGSISNNVDTNKKSSKLQSTHGKRRTDSIASYDDMDQDSVGRDNDLATDDINISSVVEVSEPEFVCVIRPAEVSIPVSQKRKMAMLSSASMAAHNLEHQYKSHDQRNFGSDIVSVNQDIKIESIANSFMLRPSSPNSSLSSSLNSLNSNMNHDRFKSANATSSESVSEGESGDCGAAI